MRKTWSELGTLTQREIKIEEGGVGLTAGLPVLGTGVYLRALTPGGVVDDTATGAFCRAGD